MGKEKDDCILLSKKESKGGGRLSLMSKELLAKLNQKKKVYRFWKKG